MKFIHISDTHFGKVYKNIDISAAKILIEERRRRFEYVIDYAIENRVEFIIHSGDLFDNEDPDYVDMLFIRKCLKRLLDKGIDFYFIRGNHDKKDGIFFDDLSNVYEFSGFEVTKYDRGDCVIQGISQLDSDLRNPADMLKRVEGRVNIAVLHSNVQNPHHNNYMPTTLNELKSLSFDYIALGHIHIPTELDYNIIYAGSLCPVSKKDAGPRGFYEVEVLNKANARFVEIEGVTFNKYVLEIRSIDETESFINSQDRNQILDITLRGFVEYDELKNIKSYFENVKSEYGFVDFSYELDLKIKDEIVHPMYKLLLSDLKQGDFLEDVSFTEGYSAREDIDENFDEIKEIIDGLFRR